MLEGVCIKIDYGISIIDSKLHLNHGICLDSECKKMSYDYFEKLCKKNS